MPAGSKTAVWMLAALCAGVSIQSLNADDSFTTDCQPFVQKFCLRCHGEKTPKADLSLSTYKDEASVAKGRKVWEGVVRMVQSGEMPPEGEPKPTAEDREQFLKAVRGVFVRHARPDPGSVTIRRLNRAEYNNTIRDLLGLDFNPAEDFPADGIGYGFDNIGDVLSLSPVLLERYLASAESIVEKVQLVPPPQRAQKVDAIFLNHQGGDVLARKNNCRALETDRRKLETKLPAGADGTYKLRARVFAEQAGDEPVKARLFLTGKELATIEVKATTFETAEVIEIEFSLDPAAAQTKEMQLGIGLANPFKDETVQRVLWIQYLEYLPPADGRNGVQRKLFAATATTAKPERTRELLTRLVTRAYRRPPETNEVERLAKLVESAEKQGLPWELAMRRGVQAVLISPKFLFRVELDDRPDSYKSHPIDEYHLASRLSYFLWSSMPDDELFALAEKKELSQNLPAQVRRMLADPRSKSLVDQFAMQWLQVGRLDTFVPDAKQFPSFNDQLRRAMRRETELFFESVIREDRNIFTLLDADYTFLNEPLAKHYRIVDTSGNRTGQAPTRAAGQPIRGEEFQRVSLSDGERGGLLTQASLLAASSTPTRTSPVKRGNWVLERILGTPPPPPPPNVPPLPESPQAIEAASVRQRLEQHRSNPACANCHARIDPIGFAFENYDSIGAFRLKDGEFPIDASGTLPDGRSFKGPAELKAVLMKDKEQFSRCLTEKLLTFALGRGVEYYDAPTIDRVIAELAKSDYKFSTLVTEIVLSEPFRLRRGKEPSP